MSNLLQSFKQTLRHWYIPLVIGIMLIVFGIYLFSVPLATYSAIAFLFSLSFLASGLLDIVFAIRNKKAINGWGWYLVDGIFSMVIGIYLVAYPNISMEILPFVVGFMLMFKSILLIGFSFELKDLKILHWGNTTITGILGLVLSILLIAQPAFTGLSLVVLTSLSFILIGIGSIFLSISLKKIRNLSKRLSEEEIQRIKDLQSEIDNLIKF